MKKYKSHMKFLSLLVVLCFIFNCLPVFSDDGGGEDPVDKGQEQVDDDQQEQVDDNQQEEVNKTVPQQEQVDDGQQQLEIDNNEVKNKERETLELTVDETKVINHPTKLWYGINTQTASQNGISLYRNTEFFEIAGLGPNGLEPNRNFVKFFKDYDIPLLRFGGTPANGFFWKDALGELKDRKPQAPNAGDVSNPQIRLMGIVEVIKTMQAINKDAQFVACVNMHRDTDENIADLAEFLQGDGSVNYNGGVNWAQRRIDLGIEKPLKNVYYELGNELDYGINFRSIEWTKENYVAACRRVIAAIKSVNEDAKIMAMLQTSIWSRRLPDWAEWHRYILKEIGGQIDYLAIHAYIAYKQSFISAMTIRSIAEDIKMITGSDRIKISHTEVGSSANTGAKYGYGSLAFGINMADWFFRMMEIPSYDSVMWHALTQGAGTGGFALCREAPDGTYVSTCYGEVRKFLANYAVGEALSLKLTDYSFDRASNVTAAVVRQGDTLNVMLVNLSNVNEYNIDMKFNGKYKLVRSEKITAKALNSLKDVGFNDISISKKEYSSNEPIESYVLNSISLVCLQLEPINK